MGSGPHPMASLNLNYRPLSTHSHTGVRVSPCECGRRGHNSVYSTHEAPRTSSCACHRRSNCIAWCCSTEAGAAGTRGVAVTPGLLSTALQRGLEGGRAQHPGRASPQTGALKVLSKLSRMMHSTPRGGPGLGTEAHTSRVPLLLRSLGPHRVRGTVAQGARCGKASHGLAPLLWAV